MKKGLIVVAAALMASAAVISCAKDERYTIGVSKIVQHAALDAVEQGIRDQLEKDGITVKFDFQNANGDVGTAAQIASVFKAEKVDLAVGIATPTAIALANALEDIPVVFSSVTDPVGAGLVDSVNAGKGNVTGLSDAIPTEKFIKEFRDLAGIKTLGYIYTSNEANSISALEEVRAACRNLGIFIVEQSITKSDEVKQAADAIIGSVDGVFITTDNTVFSAINSLIDVCNGAHKPIYSADVTGAMNGGIAIARGFNYYKSGLATAKLIERIMNGEKPEDIPTVFIASEDTDFLLDMDALADCGITLPQDVLDQANMIVMDGQLSQK